MQKKLPMIIIFFNFLILSQLATISRRILALNCNTVSNTCLNSIKKTSLKYVTKQQKLESKCGEFFSKKIFLFSKFEKNFKKR